MFNLYPSYCLALYCNSPADNSHKSCPDSGPGPSRFVVRISGAYSRSSNLIPFSPSGLRDPRGFTWQKLHLTRRDSFYQQIGLKFEEETSEVLCLEHGSVWCWNLDAPGNRSETPGKFWNVVLEKDGEDQLDWSCEKWRSVTESQGGEEYRTYNK